MNVLKYSLQDLKKQKVRTFFGIAGILISIMLLTIVGSLSDSLSYSYLDQATSQVGSADIMFTKVIQADLNFDPYFDENLIEEQLSNNIEEIDYFFPRMLMIAQFSAYDTRINQTIIKQLIYYGLNTTLEQESGNMGNLWLCDDDLTETQEIFEGPIPYGHCIITKNTAKLFNIRAGDRILGEFSSNAEELIVDAIVVPDLRFSLIETTLVITELNFAQDFLNQPGKVNYVMATLANRENIYDTRDTDQTTRELRIIAEKIQDLIGFDFTISLPKMSELQFTEQTSMTMTMMFSFLTIFSMLITGILINSILTTSIEERVREFGVLQVLGAKRSFTFKMVLSSGFLMAIMGTFIGTFLGAVIAPPILEWYFDFFDIWQISLNFIILPQTILTSILIGIGVTTAISILPAFKAGRTEIARAIDPAHTSNGEDTYSIKKEGSINGKLMFFGLGIATIGLIIFVLFPRILSTGDMNLLNSLFVGLLLCVLVGLVFATVGLVPVIEKLIGQLFKPFIRKYYPIYEISLTRYRRRNTGTIVMFALTFSFIFFVSSILEMQSNNTAVGYEFQYGSDLVLSNNGHPDNGNAVDLKLLQELQELPGIKDTAPILHNSVDIAKVSAQLFQITEEGFDFDNFDIGNIFGTIPKFETYTGDVGGYQNYYCNLLGVNESYYDTVDHDLLMWDTSTRSSDESLLNMFDTPNSCIIAKAIAEGLGITELGQNIRLMTYDAENGGYTNITLLKVVGVSQGMPGMWNFRSSEVNLQFGAGILVNMEDYVDLMQWGNLNEPTMVLDKILINLVNNEFENLKDMQEYINSYFGEDYNFILDEAVSKIQFAEENNNTVNTIMTTVLFFSIIVSLFGLIASMYSTLLERMFEIGILRAMGLKPYEVRVLLMSEAITILLSSGTLGMVIGVTIAYLLTTVVGVITEMPTLVAINLPTLAATYLISLTISVLGMWLITRKVSKWSIMEILRQTF